MATALVSAIGTSPRAPSRGDTEARLTLVADPETLDKAFEEKCLDQMVVGQLSYFERKVMHSAFEALGRHNVEELVRGQVKLKVPDPYATDGKSFQASYYPHKKILVLAESRFDKGTLVHELGHALDDLAVPDANGEAVLRSQVDPQIGKLHQSYCERIEQYSWWDKLWSRGQWSEYATTNPQEYLAEGVRLYCGGSRERDHLRRDDPEMCKYVERFLHMA